MPAAAVRMHLQPGGLLAESCPSSDEARTSYTYDPSDPSPTLGGANLALPVGSFDQSAIEAREAVVVVSSPVLVEPMAHASGAAANAANAAREWRLSWRTAGSAP